MAAEQEGPEIRMDETALYQEEVFTDRRVGTIQRLTPVDVDGNTIVNIFPGTRFVFDTGRDWGLFEFGVAGGFAFTNERWYDSLICIELRWNI